jgi:phosphoadenosine phosphosulfate reductase
MALIHMIEEEYPALWETWRTRLEQWQRAHGLPEAWISDGKWRLKEGCADNEDSHY